MKTRLWCLIVALLLLAAPLGAQNPIMDSGSITAVSSGGACSAAPAGCAVFTLPNGVLPSLTLQVSGTYVGTLLFEATSDGTNWKTITGVSLADGSSATGTTSTGQFSFQNSGLTGIRVRCTAYTSGTAVVTAVRGYATAKWFTPFFSALTVSQGTLSGSNTTAFQTSATWNDAAVTFKHWRAVITDTASASGSLPIEILGGASGSTNLFSLSKLGLATFGNGIVSGAGITSNGSFSVRSTDTIGWASRTQATSPADGVVMLTNAAGTFGMVAQYSAVPTVGTCGTSPSVTSDSTDSVGEVNVGTGGTATSCSVTFAATWAKAPRCTANVNTATPANTRALGITATTTTLTITAATAWAASDKVWWQCFAPK